MFHLRIKNRAFWLVVTKNSKRLAGALLVLSTCLSVTTSWQVLTERNNRREAVNDAVCSLLQIVPPHVSPRADENRVKFHCGPYMPPGLEPAKSIPRRP